MQHVRHQTRADDVGVERGDERLGNHGGRRNQTRPRRLKCPIGPPLQSLRVCSMLAATPARGRQMQMQEGRCTADWTNNGAKGCAQCNYRCSWLNRVRAWTNQGACGGLVSRHTCTYIDSRQVVILDLTWTTDPSHPSRAARSSTRGHAAQDQIQASIAAPASRHAAAESNKGAP